MHFLPRKENTIFLLQKTTLLMVCKESLFIGKSDGKPKLCRP